MLFVNAISSHVWAGTNLCFSCPKLRIGQTSKQFVSGYQRFWLIQSRYGVRPYVRTPASALPCFLMMSPIGRPLTRRQIWHFTRRSDRAAALGDGTTPPVWIYRWFRLRLFTSSARLCGPFPEFDSNNRHRSELEYRENLHHSESAPSESPSESS